MTAKTDMVFKKFPKIADLKPNVVAYPTVNIQNLLDFINKREEWSEDTAEKLQKRYIKRNRKPKFTLADCIASHEELEMIIIELLEALK